MKRYAAITFAALASLLTIAGGQDTAASQQSTLEQQIAGTWRLVSISGEGRDGKKVQPWGPNTVGLMMFDGKGRFSLHEMRANRAKFASGSRLEGTDDENRATVHSALAYFGRYSVDEAGKVLILRVEASS